MKVFCLVPRNVENCPWKLLVHAETRVAALIVADAVLLPEHYDLEITDETGDEQEVPRG